MGKGAILIGVVAVIAGLSILIFLKIGGLIYGTILILVGIALMIFWKEEDKVEQRKDLKSKKTKI